MTLLSRTSTLSRGEFHSRRRLSPRLTTKPTKTGASTPTWISGRTYCASFASLWWLADLGPCSGLIYQAAGFPTDYFPLLFAIPRVVGWLAHWRQLMLQQGGVKIWRPRQLYVGEGERDYVPIGQRRNGSKEEPVPVEHPTSIRSMLANKSKL